MITSVVGMLKLPIFCHMTTSNSEPSDKILLVTPKKLLRQNLNFKIPSFKEGLEKPNLLASSKLQICLLKQPLKEVEMM